MSFWERWKRKPEVSAHEQTQNEICEICGVRNLRPRPALLSFPSNPAHITVPRPYLSAAEAEQYLSQMMAQSPVDPAKLEALKTAEPYPVSKRQPDYVHVLTGWRAWDIAHADDGSLRLEALGKNITWEPKKQIVATCLSESAAFSFTPAHLAPRFDCECGIWAFKDLERLIKALDSRARGPQIKVFGQVSLWGRVIETENGWRAQYAYPSEVWLLDRELEELGLIYDVPVRCA